MNKQKYTEYLRSPEWRNKREEKLAEAKWKCGQCGDDTAGVQLEVHHLTYDRVGHERLGDLQVLCRSCHGATHKSGFIPKKTLSDKEIDKLIAAQMAGIKAMTAEESIAAGLAYEEKYGR